MGGGGGNGFFLPSAWGNIIYNPWITWGVSYIFSHIGVRIQFS